MIEPIIINNTPLKFRPYLEHADKNNNGSNRSNGKIDAEEEINSAISEYCSDNPNSCKEIVEFFSKESNYPSQSFESKPKQYPAQFRLSLAPVIGLGFQHFNYASLGSTLHVPPHQDDKGAVTNPIEVGSKNNGMLKFGFELTLDFWQIVFLNYQLALAEDNLGDYEEDVKAGPYNYYGGYPPKNRQRYASGENAYTFISTTSNKNTTKAHYLTLGFYPFSNSLIKLKRPNFSPDLGGWRDESGDSHLSIDAGIAIKQVHVVRGWDRYAAVEIMEDKNVTIFGGTVGLHYQGYSRQGSGPIQLGGKLGIRGAYYPGGSFNVVAELGFPFGLTF
ncbi:MAG: hypothetical protein WC632_02185 [Candidatus Margulisiibacteriota bacterium]